MSKQNFNVSRLLWFGLGTLAIASVGSAGDLIFFEDFESGTVGGTIVADRVNQDTNSLLAGLGDPGAIAQYSDFTVAPTGSSSQSMVLQDSGFVNRSGAPEVQWDLVSGDDFLDITRTIKVSYWHRINSETVVGSNGFVRDSFNGGSRARDIVLTASKADRSRPEGNGGYLAQSWNWYGGPSQQDPTYNRQGSFDAGDVTGTFGEGLLRDEWYRIDHYIVLGDMKDGSPAFLGDPDPNNPGQFLGYNNNVVNPQMLPTDAVSYARTLSDDLGTALGQTAYVARRTADSTTAGGDGTDDGLVIRSLQIFGEHNDYLTQFYDDISVEYVTTGDITGVMEAITAGSTSAVYDYDADGDVDETDRDVFVRNALITAYGDTNYDYMVDENDLNTIASNFNTSTSGWDNGDFNGDGMVDAADIEMIRPFWLNAFSPMVAVGLPDFEDALAAAGITLGSGIVGDYDDSGSVEQGDLNLVLNNWGQDAPFDPNGDPFDTSIVDQEELNRVLNNWGSSSSPSLAGQIVPEPTAVGLLSLGGLCGLRRRR
ncbi:MAG: dockerin type I domain-containing protein [Planctomycetota bacterium]